MTGLKQPWLGIAASSMIIVISFLAILPWDYATFGGVFSEVMMCTIPFAALVGSFWHGQQPKGISGLRQPLRGIAYLAVAGIVAAIVFAIGWVTIGGSKGATPFLTFGIIVSVVVAFWLSIIWGGWPFNLIGNKLLAGVALLVSSYLLTALILRAFNYSFLAQESFYAGTDPGGPIPAWDGLVGAVTCLAVLFLFLNLDLWPLTKFAAIMKQPLLGIVWTVATLVIGIGVYLLGTRVFGLTPDAFLVTVPGPFLFGTTVLLTMMGGSATARLSGLTKGVTSAVLAMIIGSVLAWFYLLVMPLVTSDVPDDALNHHLWLASALLGVTFPFLAMHQDFFRLWPLAVDEQSEAASEPMPSETLS